MSTLFVGLLGAFLATNPPAAMSHVASQATGITVKIPDPKDPVEKQYEKLLAEDDAAEKEVDKWIRDADAFAAKGAPIPRATLNARIDQRFAKVKEAYEKFLLEHPKHARARLAYGSFLNDNLDEEAAVQEWEKARELEPSNPAAWNNLANYYGHRGPVQKGFQYYEKAIELDPEEPVYLQNLATTVYLFRKDAREYYHITEPQVFDKALELYRKAIKLDPKNFPLATDYAQSYYGIRPLRADDALQAWNYALQLASDNMEREGVYIHLARVEINAGRFAAARQHLNGVTNTMYAAMKTRLERNLAQKERASTSGATNAAPISDVLPAATNTPLRAKPAGPNR